MNKYLFLIIFIYNGIAHSSEEDKHRQAAFRLIDFATELASQDIVKGNNLDFEQKGTVWCHKNLASLLSPTKEVSYYYKNIVAYAVLKNTTENTIVLVTNNVCGKKTTIGRLSKVIARARNVHSFNCDYCEKGFNRLYVKTRHEKTCKMGPNAKK